MAGGGEVFDHDGERFAIAMLAGAEAEDGGLIGGVDAEVEAANAFDGEDFAGGETVDCCLDRVVFWEDFAVRVG